MRRVCALLGLVIPLAAFASEPKAPPDPAFPPCPPGSVRRGAPPPDGREAWCADAERKKQGLRRVWNEDGSVRVDFSYRDGRMNGWSHRWRDGVLESSTEYRDHIEVGRRRLGEDAAQVRPSRPGDPVHPCPEGSFVAYAQRRWWCEKRREDGSYAFHGPWLHLRADGAVLKRRAYRDGLLHGTSIQYWPDGTPRFENQYRDGELHGLSVGYRENGAKMYEVSWSHGDSRGRSDWYETGTPKSQTAQAEDGTQLLDVYWYEDGTKKSEKVLNEDTGRELHRAWWPNGQLKEEGEWGRLDPRRSPGEVGTWRYWNAEGQLARTEHHGSDGALEAEVFFVYEQEERDWFPQPVERGDTRVSDNRLRCPPGSRRSEEKISIGLGTALAPMDDSGRKGPGMLAALNVVQMPMGRREACVSGRLPPRKNGPAVEYFEDGWRAAEGEYRNGHREGTWVGWGPDGSKTSEVAYRRGLPVRAVEWHANGRMRSVEHYDPEKGAEHDHIGTWLPRDAGDGVFGRWYANGARAAVGSLRDGKPHGTWIHWKEDGSWSSTVEH